MYLYADANFDGMPTGVPKVIGDGTNISATSTLRYYISDADAISNGVEVGQMYLTASLNIYDLPIGVPKIVQ